MKCYVFNFKALVLFCCSILLYACGQGVDKVELDFHQVDIRLGDQDTIHVSVTPIELDSLVEWISSDTSIVTVENGILYSKRVGNAMVYAVADNKYDSCLVCVKIFVDRIKLNRKKIRIEPGQTTNLNATLYPLNATDTLINWTSSDSTIAIVTQGLVEGKNAGTAVITATIDGVTANCRITVAELTELARLVNKLGGNTNGDLRFSLQWNDKQDWNEDDLDAHCITPNGYEIFFDQKQDRKTKGWLDVDNTHPQYNRIAIENITFDDQDYMTYGTYEFIVHRYANRGGLSGFRAEIEFNGQTYQYSYDGNSYIGDVYTENWLQVAKVTYDANGFKIKHLLPLKQ